MCTMALFPVEVMQYRIPMMTTMFNTTWIVVVTTMSLTRAVNVILKGIAVAVEIIIRQ